MDTKLFSDEADTCEECRAEEFTIRDGIIRDPGKFEAEPLIAYHAYHVMLEGFADDDDGPAWRIGNVICEESDQGFVYSETYESDEAAIAQWSTWDSEE